MGTCMGMCMGMCMRMRARLARDTARRLPSRLGGGAGGVGRLHLGGEGEALDEPEERAADALVALARQPLLLHLDPARQHHHVVRRLADDPGGHRVGEVPPELGE